MKKFIKHIKMYMFRGVLAAIPLALSFFVLRFFYIFIDKRIVDFFDRTFGYRIPGIGILLFLLILYFLGVLTSNVLGRQLLNFFEKISNRIPIIKTTYQVGKQISATLSLPEGEVFKRVVLLDYFRPGVWTIGFVTGTVVDKISNEKLLKVFVPTVPNPTSGILIILKETQVIDPCWTIDQGMKVVISGGIIGPEEIRSSRLNTYE
ncbi:MAG: DUF502 domain-containing protein [Candidatus Omnitrophota bacterium]